MTCHIGSILTQLQRPWKWTCSSASGHSLLWLTLAHLCLRRGKPSVHPVGVAVMPELRGRSAVCLLPHKCCPGKEIFVAACMPWRRGDDPFVCSAIALYSVFAARQSVRSAFVLSCERNLLIGNNLGFGMCFMSVSSLTWYWVGTLKRTVSVCVKHQDDFILIWCEEHQPVVEEFTSTVTTVSGIFPSAAKNHATYHIGHKITCTYSSGMQAWVITLWSLSPSTANGFPCFSIAALMLSITWCSFLTAIGPRSWCSVNILKV